MIWEKIINTIKDLLNRLAQLSNEEKRRLVLICTIVFCVILTIVVIIRTNKGDEKEDKSSLLGTEELERLPINAPIPAEELFLPDEPDFLPGVLLDREQREVWTEDAVMEFWQDPLRAGEEQWREKIEDAVNEILERVP